MMIINNNNNIGQGNLTSMLTDKADLTSVFRD